MLNYAPHVIAHHESHITHAQERIALLQADIDKVPARFREAAAEARWAYIAYAHEIMLTHMKCLSRIEQGTYT